MIDQEFEGVISAADKVADYLASVLKSPILAEKEVGLQAFACLREQIAKTRSETPHGVAILMTFPLGREPETHILK